MQQHLCWKKKMRKSRRAQEKTMLREHRPKKEKVGKTLDSKANSWLLKKKKKCYPEKGYQVLLRVGWLGYSSHLPASVSFTVSISSQPFQFSNVYPACSLAHHTVITRIGNSGLYVMSQKLPQLIHKHTLSFMREVFWS